MAYLRDGRVRCDTVKAEERRSRFDGDIIADAILDSIVRNTKGADAGESQYEATTRAVRGYEKDMPTKYPRNGIVDAVFSCGIRKYVGRKRQGWV